MKELSNVRRIIRERDVVHIELANGERETILDVDRVQLTGESGVESTVERSQGTFKSGKCLITETSQGKRIIDCFESELAIAFDIKKNTNKPET